MLWPKVIKGTKRGSLYTLLASLASNMYYEMDSYGRNPFGMRPTAPWSAGVKPSSGAKEEEEDKSIISDGSLFEDSDCIGEGGAAGG